MDQNVDKMVTFWQNVDNMVTLNIMDTRTQKDITDIYMDLLGDKVWNIDMRQDMLIG
jgi:hypothetical protein